MAHITLLTGGARSGKSRQALKLAQEGYGQLAFIATAEACDADMAARIAAHQQERQGQFLTVEEPLALDRALQQLPGNIEVVIIDCLAVWLGNLLHYSATAEEVDARLAALRQALQGPPCDIILVSNEVGLGLVPATSLGRRYRDMLGYLNQSIAAQAQQVTLMVSGLPLPLK